MQEETAKICAGIESFVKELRTEKQPERDKKKLKEEEFVLLLSGLSTCLMCPGISEHMGYEKLFVCGSEEEMEQAREHLKKVFEVENHETLMEVFRLKYSYDGEYREFQSFWDGKPIFDINHLYPEPREVFEKSMKYAEPMREYVQNGGFFAWDCDQRIGLGRKAYACGLITEEEFWTLAIPLARRAAGLYSNWVDYGISALCGAVYFMFCQNDFQEEDVLGFYNIIRNLLKHLFEEGGAWERSAWYQYPGKKFAMPAAEMKKLLGKWEGGDGCLATDAILVEGKKVHYMYREEPDNDIDSGWRFFSGEESGEYLENPDNIGVYQLNTLCNADPDIMPHLYAPYGKAYFREGEGAFVEEELRILEEDEGEMV